MEPTKLFAGDVVMLNPEMTGFFPGCFMMVTEPKSWGAQGFVLCPRTRELAPGRAYFRAKWEDMEYVGQAPWVPDDRAEEAAAARGETLSEEDLEAIERARQADGG